MRRLLRVQTEPGTGSSGKAAYGDGQMFCVRVGAYLSGLSEAHTESISPTSSVPWKGTEGGGEGAAPAERHHTASLGYNSSDHKAQKCLLFSGKLQNDSYLRKVPTL